MEPKNHPIERGKQKILLVGVLGSTGLKEIEKPFHLMVWDKRFSSLPKTAYNILYTLVKYCNIPSLKLR